MHKTVDVMLNKLFVRIALLAFFSIACNAQELPSQAPQARIAPYARFQRVIYEGQGQIKEFCVALRENGSFRREHWMDLPGVTEGQGSTGVISKGTKSARVFEGQLSAEELNAARLILDAVDFQKIERPAHGSEHHPLRDEMFVGVVQRHDQLQRLFFWDKKSRKPFETALKPVLSWMHFIEHHKAQEVANATPNRCDIGLSASKN